MTMTGCSKPQVEREQERTWEASHTCVHHALSAEEVRLGLPSREARDRRKVSSCYCDTRTPPTNRVDPGVGQNDGHRPRAIWRIDFLSRAANRIFLIVSTVNILLLGPPWQLG